MKTEKKILTQEQDVRIKEMPTMIPSKTLNLIYSYLFFLFGYNLVRKLNIGKI